METAELKQTGKGTNHSIPESDDRETGRYQG